MTSSRRRTTATPCEPGGGGAGGGRVCVEGQGTWHSHTAADTLHLHACCVARPALAQAAVDGIKTSIWLSRAPGLGMKTI
jgi:hypothetical protein